MYRADGASSTGHTIVIDDHYKVQTISGSQSYLVYSEETKEPDKFDALDNTRTVSQAVNRLNWDEDYIIVSAKASNGHESFMIIHRETAKPTGYANKKDFEQGKKERGIKLSLKNKSAFDWY